MTVTSPAIAAPRRAAFVFIFITVLLDMLALGIIIPVMPVLVSGFLGGDTARSAEILGLFGTGYIGLRALATGLPTWYLLNPRRQPRRTCSARSRRARTCSTSS